MGAISSNLGWCTVPLEVWDLLDFVPTVGPLLAAGGNLNIVIEGKKALPLKNDNETFTDTGSLAKIAISVADFVGTSQKTGMVTTLTDELYDALGGAVSKDVLKEVVGKAVDGLLGFLTALELNANPSYRVDGKGAVVWIGTKLGAEENMWPLYFDRQGQKQTLDVRIPAFTDGAQEIKLYVKRVDYGMAVRQSLNPKVKVSAWEKYFEATNRAMFDGLVIREFGQNEHAVTLPLEDPPDLFDIHERTGASSAVVFCLTPNFQTKCKLLVCTGPGFNPGSARQVAQETQFDYKHGLCATGLNAGTTYCYKVVCEDQQGRRFESHSKSFTTLAASEARPRNDKAVARVSISSTPQVSGVGQTTATIGWGTNVAASTDVLLGSSPEYGITGKWNTKVRKGSGYEIYQDYVKGDRYFETAHTITLNDLEPGTKYYFSAVSWVYDGDDAMDWAEKANLTFTTTQPAPPHVKVQVLKDGGSGFTGAQVGLLDGSDYMRTMSTDNTGTTEAITVEPGKSYTFVAFGTNHKIKHQSYTVPSSPAQDLGIVRVQLEPAPSTRSIVFDSVTGATVAGATARLTSPTRSVTSDSQGSFVLENLPPGNYTAQVSKSGYFTGDVGFCVAPNGAFYGGVVRLKPTELRGAVRVTGDDGQPVPSTVKAYQGTHLHEVVTVGANGQGSFSRNVTTDAAVTYRFEATPSGNGANNYYVASEEYTLRPGELANVNILCAHRDTTPPAVTSRQAEQLSPVCWALSWRTNELANCTAEVMRSSETQALITSPASFGETHEFTVDLTSAPGTLAEKAALAYRYRVRAQDVGGLITYSAFEPLPRDAVPPRVLSLLADRKGFLQWSLSWRTDEPAACVMEALREGVDQPVFTAVLAQATSHSFDLDLSDVAGLPADRGLYDYSFRVRATDASGNQVTSEPVSLPRDTKAPRLTGIAARLKSRAKWSFEARTDKPAVFKLEVLKGGGEDDQPFEPVQSEGWSQKCDLGFSLADADLRAMAMDDLSYRITATDQWGNAAASKLAKLDRGGSHPRARLVLPRIPLVAAGVPVALGCRVTSQLSNVSQTWHWQTGVADAPADTEQSAGEQNRRTDEKAEGELATKDAARTEIHRGREVTLSKVFPAGTHAFTVDVIDEDTLLGVSLQGELIAVEPPKLELSIRPRADTYRPGDKITLTVTSLEKNLEACEIVISGRRVKTLRGGNLRPVGSRIEVQMEYTIPSSANGALVVAPSVTTESGVVGTVATTINVESSNGSDKK